MVARVLAKHPAVELIFQPFNSTNVRRRMYQVWDDGVALPEDAAFLQGLAENRLDEGYIVSHWHARHSTVRAFVPGHLHVVKTTLNHLTARWMARRFPGLAMWALWRDPLAILSSVLRNGFFQEWYGDAAVDALSETAAAHPAEFGAYAELRPDPGSDAQKTAYLIGARSYFLFRHVAPEHVVRYERVLADPNAELGRVLRAAGQPPFDFTPFVHTDYNVIGRPLGEGARGAAVPAVPGVADDAQRAAVEALFAPLRELGKARLGIGGPADGGAA